MSPHQAVYQEALQAFLFTSAWWGGSMPVKLGAWAPSTEKGSETIWRGPHDDLTGIVRDLDERYDDEVLLGVPQSKPWAGGVSSASMLWAVVDGKDQLQRARRFKPYPSLVLQAGAASRRWLVWALEEPVSYFELVAANRKLAYHLRAVQKFGDPDLVWFPAPGTCLRQGRARPVPVRVARLTTDACVAEGIVGRLKEPPPKDAWLQGVAR
jgi:hypothetical protein